MIESPTKESTKTVDLTKKAVKKGRKMKIKEKNASGKKNDEQSKLDPIKNIANLETLKPKMNDKESTLKGKFSDTAVESLQERFAKEEFSKFP